MGKVFELILIYAIVFAILVMRIKQRQKI